MLIFSFSPAGFGQMTQADESSAVNVPEQAMKQVVQRILVWSFKPRNKRTEIYISDEGIKAVWLPKIKNIEFYLVPEVDLAKRGDLYFFTEPTLSEGIYEIGFGFGEPHCSASGNSWFFRLSKQRVKLWQSDGFGSGCAISSDYGSPN